MALFAKILLVFNLLAGGAYVYFAIEDWQHRQTAAASLLRHQLLIVGLPLQPPAGDSTDIPSGEDPEIPFAYVSPAGAVTDSVSKKFLEVYFKPANGSRLGGNDIVASQIGEVKRARAKVQQSLNDPNANKAITAAAYLMPLAYSLEERAHISQLLREANQDPAKADELAAMLLKKFDEVESPADTRDETERRIKIAALLVNLDPEPAWQQRVALVIGLKRYKTTLAAQAQRFQQMAVQLQRLIEQDQNRYNETVRTLERQAITLTEKLMDSEKRKAAVLDQQQKDAEHRNQIQTQVNNLEKRFNADQVKINDLLAQQTTAEQKLFDYQRSVGTTLVEIFRLEDELARRERDRLGVKP